MCIIITKFSYFYVKYCLRYMVCEKVESSILKDDQCESNIDILCVVFGIFTT